MEVYFKDLISEDASLDKLVDDLSRVMQGADDYARVIGASVSPEAREEVEGQLQSLKQRCNHLKQQAKDGARATDRLLRAHPYAALGIIFGVGLFAGAVWMRKR